MSNISVGIIEPVGGHGGMNYYDFGLSNGLSNAGVAVSLYTSNETNTPTNAKFSLKKYFCGIYGSDNKYLRGFRFLRGLILSLRNARKIDSDLIHFHFFKTTFVEFGAVLIAKIFRFPVIITVHDVESFDKSDNDYFSRNIFKLSNGLIVHNRASYEELIKKFPETKIKTTIIPHGNYLESVDENIDSEIVRKKNNINLKSKVFLFFGQIKEVKGLGLLISAFAALKKTHPDIFLIIAGKVWKDDFSKYDYQIRDLGIEDSVILEIRYIEDREVSSFYAAADFVVLPYQRIYQSGVLLMAMSYAKPVIVSNLLGMTDVVKDGSTGFVFEKNDVDSLIAAMNRALEYGDSIEVISSNAKKLMIEEFSWLKIGQKTAKFYSHITENI